jgi:hypothetical protein
MRYLKNPQLPCIKPQWINGPENQRFKLIKGLKANYLKYMAGNIFVV